MANFSHTVLAIVSVLTVAVATTAQGAAPAIRRPTAAPQATAVPSAQKATAVQPVDWLTDYGQAMKQAEMGRKMFLIYFYAPRQTDNERRFEQQALTDPAVADLLAANYTAVRLPLDYEVSIGGEKSRLMSHASFGELRGRSGLAVIDFAHDDEAYHGYVVSILPLDNGKFYRFDPRHVATLLQLPAGTLTQRTMIFAVRIHPEQPRSTSGTPDGVLFDEALQHSRHQAQIRSQGHHNWGSRFQRIARMLPRGLRPKEVVAESWPGEGLVDAAVDCVDCWRQSSGHWSAVRSNQQHFGYDIKKGNNGIWYATGLFGDYRD